MDTAMQMNKPKRKGLGYRRVSGTTQKDNFSLKGQGVKGVDKTYQWGGAKVYHQRGHWPA